MENGTFKILVPGPLTTVQDQGRRGYMSYGIGRSGVMDQESYEIANLLVGNRKQEAVLEATLFGPTIEFVEETIFAITGADMAPCLDQMPISMYEPVIAKKGQVLSLQFAKTGCRAYVAFAGGIDVPVVMGSRSTNLKCRLGGLEGRALQKGDVLAVSAAKKRRTFRDSLRLRRLQKESIMARNYRKPVDLSEQSVRVILGPQDEYFTEQGKNCFFSKPYVVSAESDRMGYRLEGEPIESFHGTDIVSDGITFGSIQVPSSGKPIILMADHQTTGGYAKIGTVYSKDLQIVAQAKPGDQLHFTKMELRMSDS